ncbi:hypothetical protein ACM43_14510 [Bradyrhizobium sp. CCBAU 45321]|nr:hypothetical protein [Bradyrhizobium sp. CCBAU 45321]
MAAVSAVERREEARNASRLSFAVPASRIRRRALRGRHRARAKVGRSAFQISWASSAARGQW